MVVIDGIGMRVDQRSMTMSMAMRFGTFPAFVIMLVMGVVSVFVFVKFRRVGVNEHCLVMFRPENCSLGGKRQDTRAQQQCRQFHAKTDSKLARHQIENQPAGMGQSELGRKICRPIRR